MIQDDQPLVLFLQETGLLTRTQINSIEGECALSGSSFYEELLNSRFMHEDDVRRALSKAISIPFVSLSIENISSEALFVLPEAFCRTHSLVAYAIQKGVLLLGVLDLDAIPVVERLRLPYTVVAHVTDRQSIKRALLYYQQLLKDTHGAAVAELIKAVEPPASPALSDLQYSAERISVGQLVDALIAQAISQSASDIHFEPRVHDFIVRYRVGERLYDALLLPLSIATSILARIKILANLHLSDTGSQEGGFKVETGHMNSPERIVFRVATMPVAHDTVPEKMVLRLARQREGKNGFMLETLGLHGSGLDALHILLAKRSGLLLVCGGENSGVSTLLYSLLDHCIDPTRSVASIEDPIVMRIPGVMQFQTKSAMGVTPASCVKAALQLDPDVLMVSDCDSQETARLVVQAANRGTFVSTSVQANSCAEGISIVSEAVPFQTFSSTLVGVVSTRLVRRLCVVYDKTKLTREALEALEARGANLSKVLASLKEEGRVKSDAQWKDLLFGRPVACDLCVDGYIGLLGLQEVVPMTLGLKDVILRSGVQEEVEAQIRQDGSLSLLEDGIFKAALGLTSIDEVFEATL